MAQGGTRKSWLFVAKDRQTHAELKQFKDNPCRKTPETIDVCRSSVAPAHLPLQSTKKIHEICFSGGAELEAIAQAAYDSIAKDGIGCTEHLEQALDKASKSVCRKLLEAILTSEAAKADYEPKDGERNAGSVNCGGL